MDRDPTLRRGSCDKIWISPADFDVNRLKGLGFLIICWKQKCHHQVSMLTLTKYFVFYGT